MSVREILEDDARLTALSREIFDVIDTNHSGTIDLPELKEALNEAAKQMDAPPPSDEEIQSILSSLDANSDRVVDPDEFKALVRQLLEAL